MYKVSEIAAILGVDNTKVFEQLLLNRDLLEDHITNEQGLLKLGEPGLEMISKLLNIEKIERKSRAKETVLTDAQREILDIERQCEILLRELDSIEEDINRIDGEMEKMLHQLLGERDE